MMTTQTNVELSSSDDTVRHRYCSNLMYLMYLKTNVEKQARTRSTFATNVVKMWECQWKTLKVNSEVKEFIR